MQTGMLHTHHLLVVLYILLFAWKAVLVFLRKKEALDRLNRRTKVPHIVLSAGFLATGIYLAAVAPLGVQTVFVVKYVVIVLIIGVGIVGIRRMSIPLTALTLLLLVYTYTIGKSHGLLLQSHKTQVLYAANHVHDKLREDPIAYGQVLYETACLRCHGAEGKALYRQSKDLTQAPADTSYIKAFIRNGAGSKMPAFDYLNEYEKDALAAYVRSLQGNARGAE